jgi:myo-inositol 2-dehydrogenase/D-chiro-inositol 1-dehydrogenase
MRTTYCPLDFRKALREEPSVRIGLLGAGRIGRIHGGNVAAHPRVTLAAVADASAEAAKSVAEQHGAKVASIDAILADKEIGAVVICTPTDMHSDLIEKAAQAGKAVFCEKPVDLSADRIRACLAVVKKTNAKLMIGFNRRFDPSFANVRRRIDAGEIGTVELVTILSRDPSPPPADYVARSGGLFRDMMIHDLDMARFLLGEEPTEVHAVGSCLVDPAIGKAGDVDTAAVLLKTASGKIAQISNSRRATYGYDQRIEVHGSGGLLAAGNRQSTTVTVANAGGYRSDPALPFFLERYAEAYRAELDAFINGVLDGKPITPSGEDGLKAQVLADAATDSAKSGQTVRVS